MRNHSSRILLLVLTDNMLIDEEFSKRVWRDNQELTQKFIKKLQRHYGEGAANVIIEDEVKRETLFRHWLVYNEIL